MSIRIRNGNFRLARTAEGARRTLTPCQFAPDSVNKRLATFGGGRAFVVIDRSCTAHSISALFTPGGLPPSSRLMISVKKDLLWLCGLARVRVRDNALTYSLRFGRSGDDKALGIDIVGMRPKGPSFERR